MYIKGAVRKMSEKRRKRKIKGPKSGTENDGLWPLPTILMPDLRHAHVRTETQFLEEDTPPGFLSRAR